MALKPSRIELFHDLRWRMNTEAESGGIVSVSTAADSGDPGSSKSVAAYAANPSGAKPVGILLQKVETYNPRIHENWEKAGFVAYKGEKVLTAVDGEYHTNMISGTPTGGEAAYLGANGVFTPTQLTGAPKVGQFRTAKDADGYAVVRVNLQP